MTVKQSHSSARAYTEEEWYEASRLSGTSTTADAKTAVAPGSVAASAPNALPADTIAVAQTAPRPDDRGHPDTQSSAIPHDAREVALDGRRSPYDADRADPAEPRSDADWEALLLDAFGSAPSTNTASPARPSEAIAHSVEEGREPSGSEPTRADAETRRSVSGEADLDPTSIAYVEADVEVALSNHPASEGAELAESGGEVEEPWTDEDFATFFREAAGERARPHATVPVKPIFPPIRVTSGLRASVEAIQTAQATQAATDDAKAEPRRRGRNRKTRVVTALRAFVENDPRYQGARQVREETRARYDELLGTAASDQRRVDAARKAYTDSIDLEVDFHLSHLASVADRIERCGPMGGIACGSNWCPRCRNHRVGGLIDDTLGQLVERYGENLENARSNLLHATILNEIVLPDPDLDREHLADFAASIVRRDHREMLGYLRRWQKDRRSAMSAVLGKRGLSLELAEDWIGLSDRDRRFYHPDNATADADQLIGWNDTIDEARHHFRGQRKRPNLDSVDLVSCRDDARYEAYLWQLRRASQLDREDIITLAQGFQCIYREFTGITKTNYPERLKFKSSIEKVKKREKSKLNRIIKEGQLPGVAITGLFELELVDLRHAISGDHQHTVKAETLRVLATQERKPTKPRKTDKKISPEAERRRMKHGARMRLLDEARARIAANQELSEVDFPGIRYAVLLHMHVLIDLNGTPRGDVERWLDGQGKSDRSFRGQWTLPRQVMVKSLYEDKSVSDSIRDISFYAIKAPLKFNYENTAPKRDDELVEGDAKDFPDEALAILAWLQQGIGHESLRITVNWPGAGHEKRGPKPKRTPEPKMTDDELDEALAARGSSLPRPLIGETDIGFLFDDAGEGAQGTSGFAQAGTPAEADEDPSGAEPGVDSEGDPPGGPSSDLGDQDHGDQREDSG